MSGEIPAARTLADFGFILAMGSGKVLKRPLALPCSSVAQGLRAIKPQGGFRDAGHGTAIFGTTPAVSNNVIYGGGIAPKHVLGRVHSPVRGTSSNDRDRF